MDSGRERTLELTRGNEDAADFLDLIVRILHLWDDLIDQDKEVSADAINRSFWAMLITLPRNRFYMQNFGELNTILAVAIQNWHAANEMEASPDDLDKEIAFITRSSYIDVVIHVATICGGAEWGRKMAIEVRREAHKETFAGYLTNLQKQFADAKRSKE